MIIFDNIRKNMFGTSKSINFGFGLQFTNQNC